MHHILASGTDGGYYVGGWQRGRRHGRGKLIKKDGTEIVGEWQYDKMISTIEVKEVQKINLEDPTDEKKEEKDVVYSFGYLFVLFVFGVIIIMLSRSCA